MKKSTSITLDDVKACIGFPKGSLMYSSLAGMCECWFGIENKKGATDEDAANVALDKLGKKMLEMAH